MKKHNIKSDERLNSELQNEAGILRGMIVESAEKNDSSKRFTYIKNENNPSMIIVDNETGKKSEVSLYAYSDVRKVLNELF
jgi:hypothetical protein